MKKAVEDARSEFKGRVRMVLSAEQVKPFDDANLKRDADRRTEWKEFQKWKAGKRE